MRVHESYESVWGFTSVLVCVTVYERVWVCMLLYKSVWECMKVHTSVWECMRVDESGWKCIRVYECAWERMSMIVHGSVWECISTLEFMWVYGSVWECMRVHETGQPDVILFSLAAMKMTCFMKKNQKHNLLNTTHGVRQNKIPCYPLIIHINLEFSYIAAVILCIKRDYKSTHVYEACGLLADLQNPHIVCWNQL